MFLWFLWLGSTPVAAAPASKTIYVDNDATGPTSDGQTWPTAFTTLQEGLDDAVAGDEIWVAAGVYVPTQLTDANDPRSVTFQLKNGVSIYGGFDPSVGVETWPARDWTVHVTVLSGDIDSNDTVDANGVVTDPANITGDNAYHVVTGSGTSAGAVVDGFTITAGKADGALVGSPCGPACGGGMYNVAGSPTLTNVIFAGNFAASGGGGMSNDGSSPTLTNVTFAGNATDNASLSSGGGVRNFDGSSPTLTNVTFSNNSSVIGGGMYNTVDSSPTLTNVIFAANSAVRGGGGMRGAFGSNATLTNVVFSGNTAGENGGGLYNNNSTVTLTNLTFAGNSAVEMGGGMFDEGSGGPTIQNSIFWNNQDSSGTGTAGASIHIDSQITLPTIRYSLVQGCNPGGAWVAACGNDGGNNQPDADPRFVTPVDPNNAPTTGGNLRLTTGSPAIDVGLNSYLPGGVTTDPGGGPRIINSTVDLGAYEFQPADVELLKRVTPTIAAPGDAITYTLAFSNTGIYTATGVIIRDSVPVSVTNVVDQWTVDPGVTLTRTAGAPDFAWAVSDLAPGAGGVITLAGVPANSANLYGTVITNTATITATNDVAPDDNSSTASLQIVDVRMLTVTKVLVPNTDPGLFILAADDQTGTEAGQGAIVTATVIVGATAAFTETAGTDTDLADYATVFRCDDLAATNGTGTSGNLAMPAADVTCTITNTRLTGAITFVKVVDGGDAQPSDWTFAVAGGPSGIAHNATETLNTSSYIVTESGPDGYALTGASGACSLSDGTVTLDVTTAGGACTITNTRLTGAITFVKVVEGGDAQPGDWTFAVAGGPSGIAHNATKTLDTGSYTVTESGPDGYALTGASGACSLSGTTITLDVTTAGSACTITNTRLTGAITFVKVVDGGDAQPSDWTFAVAGGPAAIAHNATETLDTGSYIVTESGPDGYALTGASGACSLSDGTVTLDVTTAGGACTITNTVLVEPELNLVESFGVTSVTEGQLTGEGSVACHWVTLNVQPSDPISVTVAAQNGFVTVAPHVIILDANNWDNLTLADSSNFVCVRAVNDDIDQHAATQTCKDRQADLTGQSGSAAGPECGDRVDFLAHTTDSANPTYAGIGAFTSNSLQDLDADPATVDVLVRDDDRAGVVLTESFGVSDLDEDGHPVNLACYWVTLNSQPTAEVTVTPLADGQVLVTPASVVINALTWNALGAMSNRVCVTPVQDDSVEGTPNAVCTAKKVDIYGAGADDGQVCGSHLGHVTHAVSSSDAKYNGPGVPVGGNGPDLDGNPRTVDVLIRDDDTAGLIFTPAVLSGVEGGAVTYRVRLASRPTASVSVSAGTIQAAGLDATTLTFTPDDWNTSQEVTVSLPNDDQANGVRVLELNHAVASADPAYNGLSGAPVTLPATVSDDDAVSVLLNTGSVELTEGGAGASYTVQLTAAPAEPVLIGVDGGDLVRALPGQLTFDAGNWNVAQTVTLTAVDDDVDRGDTVAADIEHTSSGALAVGSIRAVIVDNDIAGLSVGQPESATLDEGAGTTYPVALATRPTGPVQVYVVTDGKTAGTPTVLTFDASNWNVAQTVTLTAADDNIDTPVDVRTALVNHAVLSADGQYDGLVVDDMRVDVTDNDMAGLIFSRASVDVTAGSGTTYSIVLATQPLAPVLVALAPSAGVAVDVSCIPQTEGVDACLLFTSANWNVPQNVTVTVPGRASGRIDHRSASADTAYDGREIRLSVIATGDKAVFLPLVVR